MLFFPNNKIFLRKSVIFARFFAFYRKKYHIFDSFCYFRVVHIRRCWLLWYQQISSCMWLVYWQRLYVSELYSFISMNWTCRTSSSSQKLKICGSPEYHRYNTRAHGCACILYYLVTVKASYRVSVFLDIGKRILGEPPPSTRPTTGMHLLSDVATRGCRRFLQTIRVQQAGRNEWRLRH